MIETVTAKHTGIAYTYIRNGIQYEIIAVKIKSNK